MQNESASDTTQSDDSLQSDNFSGNKSDYVAESDKNVEGEVTVSTKLFPVNNSDDTKTFHEEDNVMEVDKTALITGPDQSDTKEVSNSDDTKTVPEEESAMQVDKTAVISGPDQSETKDSIEVMVSNKRPLSDPQMCPFKKRFRNQEGKTYTFDNTGDDGPVHISDNQVLRLIVIVILLKLLVCSRNILLCMTWV